MNEISLNYKRLDKINLHTQEISKESAIIAKIGKIRNNSLVILDFTHTPEALKICLKKEKCKNQQLLLILVNV